VFTTRSFVALGEFVKARLGITLLPAFSLAAEIASGALAAIAAKSAILTTPEAHVMTRSSRELSNAAKSFPRCTSRRRCGLSRASPPHGDHRDDARRRLRRIGKIRTNADQIS
jgi:hypothetical protein